MANPTPRLPSSIGFKCHNPACSEIGRVLTRTAVFYDEAFRWHCKACRAFTESCDIDLSVGPLRSPLQDPVDNALVGGIGGALLGLAVAGAVGLIIGTLAGSGLGFVLKRPARQVGQIRGKVPTFVSFDFDDARMRDLFVGQGRHPGTPWEIIDWSAHEPFTERWKTEMRKRILRSDALVLLVGTRTHSAEGALWEVRAALEFGIPAFGVWLSEERGSIPPCFRPEHIIQWTWEGVAAMIHESAASRFRSGS